jgi:hypothetical protein
MDLFTRKKLLISEIVKIGLNIPFQSVDAKILCINKDGFLKQSLSITFSPLTIPINSKGIYVIYASKDGIDECLYIGESDYCVSQRIRRFFKELTGCANKHEDHAAASKAKKDGYSLESHTYKVKWIPWNLIIKSAQKFDISVTDYFMNNLDSQISYFLKSKYNHTTYPLYGYSDATLKDFLGY